MSFSSPLSSNLPDRLSFVKPFPSLSLIQFHRSRKVYPEYNPDFEYPSSPDNAFFFPTSPRRSFNPPLTVSILTVTPSSRQSRDEQVESPNPCDWAYSLKNPSNPNYHETHEREEVKPVNAWSGRIHIQPPMCKGSNEVGESRQKLNPFDFTPRLLVPLRASYTYLCVCASRSVRVHLYISLASVSSQHRNDVL